MNLACMDASLRNKHNGIWLKADYHSKYLKDCCYIPFDLQNLHIAIWHCTISFDYLTEILT